MKKIVITSLTLLLVTQSASYLFAPVEPAPIKPVKEQSSQQQEAAAEKNYENETVTKTSLEQHSSTETPSTQQESSSPANKETSISLEPTENKEEDTFTDVLIEKGAESDVDHAQEKVKTDADKKTEAQALAKEINDQQAEKIKTLVENTAQELETNSSDSIEILEKSAEKMGIALLAPERQNIIMQNLKIEWNQLAAQYKDSSIPADQIKEFLSRMNSTIKNG